MQKTRQLLDGIILYDKFSSLPALRPPRIGRQDIVTLIHCPSHAKAMARYAQRNERARSQTATIEAEIQAQEQLIAKANRKTTHILPLTDPNDVARHNDWVERGLAAVRRRNELALRLSETQEEAKEQLERLHADALAAIDEDIAGALQRLGQVAQKLADSADAQDDMVAMEVCFLGLKAYAFLIDQIDGNVARKEARDANAELARLMILLCTGEESRNHLTEIYRRSVHLMQGNADIFRQLQALLQTVEQAPLRDHVRQLAVAVERKLGFEFRYNGVVDPAELAATTAEIHKAIAEIQRHCGSIDRLMAASAQNAGNAMAVQQRADALTRQIAAGVEKSGTILVSRDVLCEIVDRKIIDDFFPRDIKPAMNDLRRHLAETLGNAELERILTEVDDVHYVARSVKAVSDAALTQLAGLRERAPAAIEAARRLQAQLEKDLVDIVEVPRRNAHDFHEYLRSARKFSLVPFVGTYFAFEVFRLIGRFRAGFISSNEVYRDLSRHVASTLQGLLRLHLIVAAATIAAVLLTTAIVALVSSISGDMRTGLIIVAFAGATYGLTALFFFLGERRLRDYAAAGDSVSPSDGGSR